MLTPTIEHQLSLITQSLLLDRLHVLAAVSALSLHSNALLCLLLLRRSVLSSFISVTVHSSYLIYRQQGTVHLVFTKGHTSLTLAPTSLPASLRRGSGVLAHDFLQDLSKVGISTALLGEAGEGGELLYIGLVVSVSEQLR